MGSWRNRPPRRFYRERPPPRSPPRSHQPDHSSDGVPLWEKRFCSVVGSVPWWKVVNAKNFIYCNSNVLNWDDSASEEAFHNAKRRYWASINRLPCNISLPDPNIYIDEINWNPVIDPELVGDLDRAYFAPDEEINGYRENKKAKKSAPSDGHHSNQYSTNNPWECNNVPGSGSLKDADQGWNQWDSHINELGVSHNNENPWETSYVQASDNTKVMGWGHSADSSWGWNQEGNNISQSKFCDNVDSGWKRDCKAVGLVKNKGWSDTGNSSWSRNHWQSRNSGNNGDYPWNDSFIQDGGCLKKDLGPRSQGDSSWGRKQWDHYTNQPKSLELKRTTADWEPWSEGFQKKREDCHWYVSAHKSSRFQRDGYQSGNCWSKGRATKRVNFAPQ